jgi:DNA repair protein NreA
MKPDNYCVICKGTKNMCGLGYCPILKKIARQHRFSKEIKQDVFGASNEAFVGSGNYPNVSWGPVLSLESHKGMRAIYEEGYGKVIEYRAAMVKGRRFGGITPSRRSVEETQEAALSVKPVDLEINFSRKPRYDMRFSSVVQPTGASAPMRRVRVCDNPKIPKKVDSLISEGRKARETAIELYGKGLDNYYITNVLSVGKLGLLENRIMVPTRWSITATDDMLGKHLIEKVREYPQLNKVWAFSHESFSNHYEILVMPGAWEFENFEAWCPNTVWNMKGSGARVSREYEPFHGRSKYAASQAGAYYAVRLGVLEFLERIRRQGRVVAIREVYSGYQVPVGVFQVRENTRDAMENPEMHPSVKEALDAAAGRLQLPVSEYTAGSRVIGQRNLLEFL